MKKTFLFCLVLATASMGRAQKPGDSLFATMDAARLILLHTASGRESLAGLARYYAVAPSVLAAENGLLDTNIPAPGKGVRIPLGPNNLGAPGMKAIPVLYRCRGGESLRLLAGSTGLPFETLQNQNPGLQPSCTEGRRILIGYLHSGDTTETSWVNGGEEADSFRREEGDSLVPETPGEELSTEEAAFRERVEAGAPLRKETGPVVFFPGGARAVYYAFHSTLSRGTVLRIRNPANGREVYARVIGPLPVTKKYYKALAAVSENARRALGSLGDARMWCEVAHAGY